MYDLYCGKHLEPEASGRSQQASSGPDFLAQSLNSLP